MFSDYLIVLKPIMISFSLEGALADQLLIVLHCWKFSLIGFVFENFDLKKHQSKCLFKVVDCPNEGCPERFAKRDMDIHMVFECSWRKVDCEYCQESFISKNRQQHSGVCQKFPVQCTNNCGLKDIPREKLVVHIRDDCPLTEVDCEYKNLGCEEVFPRTRKKSHSESHVERHLNLALRGLEATQYEFKDLVSVVEDQSQQIERLMSTVQDQTLQIQVLTTTAKGQSEQTEALKVKVNSQAQQIKKLEEELHEASEGAEGDFGEEGEQHNNEGGSGHTDEEGEGDSWHTDEEGEGGSWNTDEEGEGGSWHTDGGSEGYNDEECDYFGYED